MCGLQGFGLGVVQVRRMVQTWRGFYKDPGLTKLTRPWWTVGLWVNRTETQQDPGEEQDRLGLCEDRDLAYVQQGPSLDRCGFRVSGVAV